MNHDQAAPLISDWVRGTLARARSVDVERHVAECAECRDAAEGARALVAEVGRAAREAREHPSSDALARFVTDPDSEPIGELARVGVHLRGCAPCSEDVSLMREASAPSWWRPIRAWWASAPAASRLLQPALAVAAVALMFPAWNGLVDAPRERASLERRLSEAEAARARADADARASAGAIARGGGVRALVLRPGARSASVVPELRLREGQLLQPLLLDVVPPPAPLTARVVREGGGEAWSASGARAEFFDAANGLVGLHVPATALTPGEYRVELASAGGEPFFTSRFRILPDR